MGTITSSAKPGRANLASQIPGSSVRTNPAAVITAPIAGRSESRLGSTTISASVVYG
jgi:hypothetical protein